MTNLYRIIKILIPNDCRNFLDGIDMCILCRFSEKRLFKCFYYMFSIHCMNLLFKKDVFLRLLQIEFRMHFFNATFYYVF